jgi:predicted metal-dependent hydrolase
MASSSPSTLTVSGIRVELVRNEIKNIHIGVYPPHGRVRIAVPLHIDNEAARLAIVNKLPWLKRQIAAFDKQQRLSDPEAVTGESWYLFGQRYRLRVTDTAGKPEVVRSTKTRIDLHVPLGCSRTERLRILDRWYRTQLREVADSLFTEWELRVGVKANFWGIKRMKTKWGSCNHKASRIWINAELAKKPIECLEFIIVHELIHLIEPSHNEKFLKLMDKHLPNWETIRKTLNSNPLAHEKWQY